MASHAGEISVHTDKVIGVFNNEEESDLPSNRLPVWEGHMPSLHAKELRHGAEHPDLDSLVHMRIRPELCQKNIHTPGSSIVKCDSKTSLVHSHCSLGVGTLFC